MEAEKRLYRADDGRLVAAGNPDAVELAYPVGAKVSAVDEQRLDTDGPVTKRRAKPADKSARPAGDK